MTDLLAILTSLSQVLGFPAALALAWAAFVMISGLAAEATIIAKDKFCDVFRWDGAWYIEY